MSSRWRYEKALGDVSLPHHAAEQVATAFTAVGGRRQHRYDVAGELLAASDRFWGAPVWTEHTDLPVAPAITVHAARRHYRIVSRRGTAAGRGPPGCWKALAPRPTTLGWRSC
jgi:hypothetical protein